MKTRALWKGAISLTLLGLGIFSQYARAGSSFVESPVDQCALLFLQSVENSKTQLPESSVIPESVQLPRITKDDSLSDFNVGVQWFRSAWTPKARSSLESLVTKIRDGQLSEKDALEARAQIKDVRSKLKFLRFLFMALREDHETPDAFDELTTALGKLREAMSHQNSENWPKLAKRVLKAMKSSKVNQIDEEIAAFKPAKRKNFEKWAEENLKETRKILSKGKGTPVAWHDARKNLQALLSVYEVMLLENPEDQQLQSIVTFLLQQTEPMGDEVGEHEVAVADGALDYDNDVVIYPSGITQNVLEFIRRVER